METPKVFESEYRFCLILWENEPVSSRTLVELCRARLGWKPTTTYTVIKRLSERGILKNDHSVVTSLVSKEAVQRRRWTSWWKRLSRGRCRPSLQPSPGTGGFLQPRLTRCRP